MSKTIAGKIIAAVISVFKENFTDFVKKLYRKIPDDLQDKIGIIIQVVDNIDWIIKSPAGDVIVDIIPGNIDDEFREWLLDNIPKAMAVVEGLELKGYDKHTIASLLTKQLTGVSFGQAAITTEVVYQNVKK